MKLYSDVHIATNERKPLDLITSVPQVVTVNDYMQRSWQSISNAHDKDSGKGSFSPLTQQTFCPQ